MAFFTTNNVSIKGVAACVPSQITENIDISFFREGEAEKVIESTGVERHRVVDNSTCTSDLCFHAAEKLIAELNWSRSGIDVLIFTGLARDYIVPHTSAILQDRLGLPTSCMVFDLPFGCPGFIYGLSILSKLLMGGEMKKGLLLVGDMNSALGSKEDKTYVPLFSDAGTATALEFDPAAEKSFFHVETDGRGAEAIIIKEGGYRNYFTPDSLSMKTFEPGVKRTGLNTIMQGMDVMMFAISKAPESLIKLLNYTGKFVDDIDYFLLHQANKFINERIKKKLKIDASKVPSNLKDFGNTGPASIPLLMVTELKKELEERKLSIMCCAFGAGLAWGSAFFETDKIVCCDLIEI